MPSYPINASVTTVGTATAVVVGQSPDAQVAVIQNLEPENTASAYAKAGYQYLVQREFTVASPGTAIFEMATGEHGVQIDYYEILSTLQPIKAELVEGATVTTSGTAISAYNMNRNSSDVHESTLTPGTAITGGTVVAAEYITADKHAASGGSASSKIFTLKPNTDYGLKFVNKGNNTTTVFFQMTFAEKYNGQNDVWLGGDVDNAVRVRGGQTIVLPMIQNQTLSATAERDNQLGVLRQD